MFGDYLLVSPVVEKGQSVKQIYLPQGKWTDYFRGTEYDGSQTISYQVNPTTWDDIPLFIKSGAIIPTIDVMNYIGEKPVTRVYLDIFPDTKQTSFNYYDDDGITYNYERGDYFLQTIGVEKSSYSTSLSFNSRVGSYRPSLKTYLCKIHNSTAHEILINGKAVKALLSLDALMSSDAQGWATGKDIYGDVVWINVPAGLKENVIIK
jgi:alpha-glucosidase